MLWCFPEAIPRRAGRIGRTVYSCCRFGHGDRGEWVVSSSLTGGAIWIDLVIWIIAVSLQGLFYFKYAYTASVPACFLFWICLIAILRFPSILTTIENTLKISTIMFKFLGHFFFCSSQPRICRVCDSLWLCVVACHCKTPYGRRWNGTFPFRSDNLVCKFLLVWSF